MLVPSFAQRACRGALLVFLAAVAWSLSHSGETLAQSDNASLRSGPSRARPVNCDAAQTIGKALQQANPGDTIVVSGTCHERVFISTDRVTLDGQGGAVLDGGGGAPTELSGLVTIDSARGVTITGFTIQNGPGDGILALGAATVVVRNTTVQDNASMGVDVIDHSTAQLTDFTARRNLQGIDVFNSSLVILRGNIIISDNRSFGSDLGGRSTMEIRGAHVQAMNNEVGLGAGNGQLVVYGLAASQGSSIIVSNNRFAGFGIGTSTFESSVQPRSPPRTMASACFARPVANCWSRSGGARSCSGTTAPACSSVRDVLPWSTRQCSPSRATPPAFWPTPPTR